MTTYAMRSRNLAGHTSSLDRALPLPRGVQTTSLDRTAGRVEGTVPRPRYYRRSKLLHPQWMRTLEEKYQRLHMKITRSTSSMKHMYNSAIGRAVIDQRLTRVNGYNKSIKDIGPKECIQKPRKISDSLNTDLVAEDNCENDKDSNRSEASVSSQKERDLDLDFGEREEEIRSNVESVVSEHENHADDDDKSDRSHISERVPENEQTDFNNECDGAPLFDKSYGFMKEADIGHKEVLNMSGDNNMNSRFNQKPGLKSNKKNVNIIENVENSKNICDKRPVDERTERVIGSEQGLSFITPAQNPINQLHSIRAKTSQSKRSCVTQKTSKSCPAAMESKQNQVQSKHTVKNVPTLRARTATNRTKNGVKIFSRMSQEAQHAMSETMKERSIPKTPEPEQGNFEEQERPSIELNLKTVSLEKRKLHNGVKLDEDVYGSHCEIEDIIHDDAYTDTDMSFQSSRRRPVSTKTNRTRLPYIPAEPPADYFTLGQLKHSNFRLPGIGRYEIATFREKTFEITPPGYDIRYSDMAVFEEGEVMELPSSDIRDRAVEKCQDWLSRYTPRNNFVPSNSVKDIV